MAREVTIFLCLLIVVMDVTAGILGIEAEIAQNKVCLNQTNQVFNSIHIKNFITIVIISVVLRSEYIICMYYD